MKLKNWKALTLILVIAIAIDIFVPDPLPFIDEVILIAGAIFSFLKGEKVIK